MIFKGLSGCFQEYSPGVFGILPDNGFKNIQNNQNKITLSRKKAFFEKFKADFRSCQSADVSDADFKASNEDFNINLKVTESGADASYLFKDWKSKVLFEKGASSLSLSFEVADDVEGTHSVTIEASSRGYSIADATKLINVTDYYYVTLSLKDNTEGKVQEGKTFVLVADVDKAPEEDIVLNLKVNAADAGFLTDMPATLAVPAGQLKAETSGITADEARKPEHDVKSSPVPRMETDWIRFYVDNSYTTANQTLALVNKDLLLY